MLKKNSLALIAIAFSLFTTACGQKDTTARATSQNNTNGMNTSGTSGAGCLNSPINFSFQSADLNGQAYAAGTFPSNDPNGLGNLGALGSVSLGGASSGGYTVSKSGIGGSIRLSSTLSGSGQLVLSGGLISALPANLCPNNLSFVVAGSPINYGYFYLQLSDGNWYGPISL